MSIYLKEAVSLSEAIAYLLFCILQLKNPLCKLCTTPYPNRASCTQAQTYTSLLMSGEAVASATNQRATNLKRKNHGKQSASRINIGITKAYSLKIMRRNSNTDVYACLNTHKTRKTLHRVEFPPAQSDIILPFRAIHQPF